MADPRTSARSALNLRTGLAVFGLLSSLVLGLLALAADAVPLAVVLLVLAGVAAADLAVLARRRADRTRAHRGADHRHDSPFE